MLVLLIIVAGAYVFFRWRYPLEYREIIDRCADEYRLNRLFVYSVICTESRYNKDVKSSAGAVGLMQIMPSTGEWIAKKKGYEGFTEEALLDPETNISFGCWYLRYLSDKYDGREILIMAAYNAGPKNVEKWLNGRPLDSFTEDDIAFKETKNYVKKIKNAEKIYSILY